MHCYTGTTRRTKPPHFLGTYEYDTLHAICLLQCSAAPHPPLGGTAVGCAQNEIEYEIENYTIFNGCDVSLLLTSLVGVLFLSSASNTPFTHSIIFSISAYQG